MRAMGFLFLLVVAGAPINGLASPQTCQTKSGRSETSCGWEAMSGGVSTAM